MPTTPSTFSKIRAEHYWGTPITKEESCMRSIDIHAHLTPQCFWRATEGGGDSHTLRREQDARGQQYAVVGSHRGQLPPRARWTPEERLADMNSLVRLSYLGFRHNPFYIRAFVDWFACAIPVKRMTRAMKVPTPSRELF